MEARTNTPVYARLEYNKDDIKIALTEPWHGRVKQCVKVFKKLGELPISLRTSSIAARALSGAGVITDTITLTMGGLIIEFTAYEVAQWVAEGIVSLAKDAAIKAPSATSVSSAHYCG